MQVTEQISSPYNKNKEFRLPDSSAFPSFPAAIQVKVSDKKQAGYFHTL